MGLDHVLCESEQFVLHKNGTVGDTQQTETVPLWVWPVVSIALLILVIFCYLVFSNAAREGQAENNHLHRGGMHGGMMVGGQPLLDASDAHPLQPPPRPSLFALPAAWSWRLTAYSNASSEVHKRTPYAPILHPWQFTCQ